MAIWDRGIWVPVGDPREGYRDGDLKFELYGHKLARKVGSREDKEQGEAGRLAVDQGMRPCWLDGEIVMLNEHVLPDFGALQNAFDNARTKDITFFLFDVMHHDGLDLRQVALVGRRALLKQLLEGATDSLRFNEAFAGAPRDVATSACTLGLDHRAAQGQSVHLEPLFRLDKAQVPTASGVRSRRCAPALLLAIAATCGQVLQVKLVQLGLQQRLVRQMGLVLRNKCG